MQKRPSLLRYRPGTRAKQLAMPLLVCVADQDTAASVTLAVQAARQAPRASREAFFRRRIDIVSLGNVRLGYTISTRVLRVDAQI